VQRKQVLGPRNRAIRGYYLKALLIASISIFLIFGCEGGSKPSKVTVVKRAPRQKLPPKKEGVKVVQEKKEPPYTYNPVGKRDPFLLLPPFNGMM